MTPVRHPESSQGFGAALGAFLLWGLLPIYWKSVQSVNPMEILCHRIIWSLVFISIILTIKHRWTETFRSIGSLKSMITLLLSSLCIGGNWLLYIWAVNNNHVLETSLGYYINPLINIMLGFLFFRERPTRLQYIAIGLATLAVANSIISYGSIPWISLALGISFSIYGVMRKIAPVESLPGLFLETLVLSPFALTYIVYLQANGASGFLAGNVAIDLLLICAGVVTATPLIGFAYAARRLQLTTLGILQYLAPSIAFLLGVFLFKEPFSSGHLLTFGLIWAALALYTADSVRTIRAQRKAARL
jgi:chloramphenicol-sensitive protein RarD